MQLDNLGKRTLRCIDTQFNKYERSRPAGSKVHEMLLLLALPGNILIYLDPKVQG